MSDHPDYWIAQTIGRNVHETWHRYRHIPSGAGGTYGWWLVCGKDGQGPFVGDPVEATAAEPPKGARVCRRCRAGIGRWEMGPETPADVLDEGDGTPANEDPRPFSRPPRLDLVTRIPVVPGSEKASHVYLTPDERQVLDAYLLPSRRQGSGGS